ncbi:MAG: hypothetical protein HN985_09985 [Planctomycetaceae bacterium]|jgi:hypothetical protein|nr:hypothetical protein [Planctomycetaceae bacterium]MBT6054798.1 hypothetical protein [Planctomycetaceae bacterium]MBT6644120.1 hypothetical protein [Planctomycetaceae bacterium]MBT6920040.1 hypothetical protein [Planctomycetaceae bacterium]
MGKSLGVGPKYLFGENTLRDAFADVERDVFVDVKIEQWLGGQIIQTELRVHLSHFKKNVCTL